MNWEEHPPTQRDRFHARWTVIAALLGALAGAALQFFFSRDVTDARLLEVRQELFKEQARSDNLEHQLQELKKASEAGQSHEPKPQPVPAASLDGNREDSRPVPGISTGQEPGSWLAELKERVAAYPGESISLPDKIVSQYWGAVAAEDYRTAWSLLSPGFRNNNHAGDYDNYVHARQAMHLCSVSVEDLGTREINQGSAVVEGTIVFRVGSLCQRSKESFYFYLVGGDGGDWRIDRVARR